MKMDDYNKLILLVSGLKEEICNKYKDVCHKKGCPFASSMSCKIEMFERCIVVEKNKIVGRGGKSEIKESR